MTRYIIFIVTIISALTCFTHGMPKFTEHDIMEHDLFHFKSDHLNDIFQRAKDLGRANVMSHILNANDSRLNLGAKDNIAIRMASEWGFHDAVAFLLKDPRVDPGAKDNYAIRMASKNGHADIVQLLIDANDPRIDPGAMDNDAIRCASENGHTVVVKNLLQMNDSRVDPSANRNYALKKASEKGHVDIIKLLLQTERVDPAADESYAFLVACVKGHYDIVKLLLPLVDPTIGGNYAMQLAKAYRRTDIIELLSKATRM